MAELNSTLVKGNLRVTSDINSNGNIKGAALYDNGTRVSVAGHTHSYAGSSSAGGAATSALSAGQVSNALRFIDSDSDEAKVSYNGSEVKDITLGTGLTINGSGQVAIKSDAYDSRYLKLSGGTIYSSGTFRPLCIKGGTNDGSILDYKKSDGTLLGSSGIYLNADMAYVGPEVVYSTTLKYPKLGIQYSTGAPVYTPDNGTTKYTLVHSGNIGSQSVSYADSAGYAGYISARIVLTNETSASVGWYKIASTSFSTWKQCRATFIVHNAYGSNYGDSICSISLSYDGSALNTNSKILEVISGFDISSKLCYVKDSSNNISFYLYKEMYEHQIVFLIESSNITWESGGLGENKAVSITPTAYASYLPLSGGTLTGKLTLSSAGLSVNASDGYDVDSHGNFIHKSTGGNTNYFHLDNAASTKQLKYYWETGILSVPDGLTVGGTNVSLAGHTHSYLPLTGGTIYDSSKDTPLIIKSSSASSWLLFKKSDDTNLGYIGVNTSKKPAFYDSSEHQLAYTSDIPTNTNQLTNGAGFITGMASGWWNYGNTSWTAGNNVNCDASNTASNVEWSIDCKTHPNYDSYFHIWSTNNSKTILACYPKDNRVAIPNGNLAVSGTITSGGATVLTSHQSVSSSNNTASWGSAVTVGTVGGTDLKFTMPSNPNTDTKVVQNLVGNNYTYKRPVLMGYSSSNDSTPSFSSTTYETYACNKIYAIPQDGYLYAAKLYSGGTEVSVSGHTHSYAGSTTSGGAANSVKEKFKVYNSDSDSAILEYDGSTAKNLYISGNLITTSNNTTTIGMKFGTTSNTACVGNDSRLSDARTPTAHDHSRVGYSTSNPSSAASSGYLQFCVLSQSAYNSATKRDRTVYFIV